ncbi:MAG TPA: GMC oxidoreductase [Acidimicrobiales bacterium]|nr:GMC oxidoreductase [Acidimicrobiales bacterium]
MARDVIVVGAGGGGPVLAKELAAQGLDVLLLEAGPFYTKPDRDWVHLENEANNPLTGYFRFGPADRSQPAWYRETPQNSFLWQLAGVGGTTLHYYGNCPRAMPGVFQGYSGADASAYDSAVFPFTYAELVPYYEWVEHTLPVQTAAQGTKEEVFFAGAATLGIPHNTNKNVSVPSYRAQENAILQPGGTAGVTTVAQGQAIYPHGTGCTFCGYCFQGCKEPFGAPFNLKAKRTTLVSYVPMALTAGAPGSWAPHGKAVTLVPNAFATKVHTTMVQGALRACAVTWRDTATGQFNTEEASVIVMAGGTTENPRLWLNSGLPNPNGWVGQGYTDHYFDWLVGVFANDTFSSRGVGSSARVDWPGRGGLEQVGLPPALQAFSLMFSNSGMRGYYSNGAGSTDYGGGPLTDPSWDGPTGRTVGKELKSMLSNIDKLVNVLVITDDDVQPENRVTLSALNADDHGPVAKVEFPRGTRSHRTVANREFMARKAGELLRGAGATKVIRLDWPPLILHVQSTMRMGVSEADSVLDANAKSRWVDGLYIADNSALANALGGPNPTLTCQALATRTAERISQFEFGGDAFVSSGSPVVSTDPAITAALPPELA